MYCFFSWQFEISFQNVSQLCTRKRPCVKMISSKSFQIPSECTIWRLLFLFCLQFQIVLNTVKMHHLLSLISIFFTVVPNSFECRQNALFSVLVLKMFSEVPYLIRCRQNAPFSVLVFKIVSAIPNRYTVIMHALSCS